MARMKLGVFDKKEENPYDKNPLSCRRQQRDEKN